MASTDCAARAPAAFFNRPPIAPQKLLPLPLPIQHNEAQKEELPPEQEVPAGPKQVQFAQREQKQAVQLKQVEGSNDGGATTTPNVDLAAWYSEEYYDIPTYPSWMNATAQTEDASATSETSTTSSTSRKTGPHASGGGGGGGGFGSSQGGTSQDERDKLAEEDDEKGKQAAEKAAALREAKAARYKNSMSSGRY